MAAKTIHDSRYKHLLVVLRNARITAGLSQIQVAEKLSAVQSFVSDCENGERRIDVIEFLDFASLYKIDIHKLVHELQALSEDA